MVDGVIEVSDTDGDIEVSDMVDGISEELLISCSPIDILFSDDIGELVIELICGSEIVSEEITEFGREPEGVPEREGEGEEGPEREGEGEEGPEIDGDKEGEGEVGPEREGEEGDSKGDKEGDVSEEDEEEY